MVLTLNIPIVTSETVISMLGVEEEIKWSSKDAIHIQMPELNVNSLPCKWAWVFKLDFVK